MISNHVPRDKAMKLLFVHQNFPGQYLHLARYLGAQPGNEVVFLTQRKDASSLRGVKKIIYAPKRKPGRQTHHYLRETEAGVLNGQEVARAMPDMGFIATVTCASVIRR